MLANLPSNQLATYVIHFNPQTGFSRILGAGVRGVWSYRRKSFTREATLDLRTQIDYG